MYYKGQKSEESMEKMHASRCVEQGHRAPVPPLGTPTPQQVDVFTNPETLQTSLFKSFYDPISNATSLSKFGGGTESCHLLITILGSLVTSLHSEATGS